MSNEHLQCDECGRFGANEIADRQLCDDCIAQAGCSCAGDADEN